MRMTNTDPDPDTTFAYGIIFTVAMFVLLAIAHNIAQWLIAQLMNSPVQSVVQWANSEQTVTYVPADVMFMLLPLVLFLVIVGLVIVASMNFNGGVAQ